MENELLHKYRIDFIDRDYPEKQYLYRYKHSEKALGYSCQHWTHRDTWAPLNNLVKGNDASLFDMYPAMTKFYFIAWRNIDE